MEGREGGVKGAKVLQLNYIVCGEEMGQTGRWQLTNVAEGQERVGRYGGVLQCSHALKGQRSLINGPN